MRITKKIIPSSSMFDRNSTKIIRHITPKPIVVKYTITSIVSTAVDFATFSLLLYQVQSETLFATFGGGILGANITYLALQKWVFKAAPSENTYRRILKFMVGILISLLLNLFLVWILYYFLHFSTWHARISAALIAWAVGYWFNQAVVFKVGKKPRNEK